MPSARPALAILLLLGFLAPAAVLAPLAAGGDADDPDMDDKADDAASGRAARDLIAGWVTNETVDGIEFDLQMSALEPFPPYTYLSYLPSPPTATGRPCRSSTTSSYSMSSRRRTVFPTPRRRPSRRMGPLRPSRPTT